MNKIVTLYSLLILMSCKSQTKHTLEVEQLIKSTRENMVFVEGGTFMQGHPNGRKASRVHEVTLDSYSINKYETTYDDFDVYTNANGLPKVLARFRDPEKNSNTDDVNGKYGAWGMNWFEAQKYCQWLGNQLGVSMNLPTEAQWEYAARSRGLDVEHATNSGIIEGGDKDNYGDGEVGSFPPNPLGLYDMSGGRPEWVLDWFGAYPKTAVVNPVRDSIKYIEERVIRGTHTLSYSVYSRAAEEPTNTGRGIGVRCVCNEKMPVN